VGGNVSTLWRRTVIVSLLTPVVLGVSGCLPVIGPPTSAPDRFPRNEYGVVHSGPEPTAMTYEDGVEVWDLTVAPSTEAFGIDTDVRPNTPVMVGAYSSTSVGPRPVQLLLPEGRSVQVDATEVIFEASDHNEAIVGSTSDDVLVPAGRLFGLQINAAIEHGPDDGRAVYRDVLGQLDLPLDSLAELEAKIVVAENADPVEDWQLVGVGESLPAAGGLQLSVGTSFRPTEADKLFHLKVNVVWDAIPIP
jgi:hypothetical protein